MSSTTRLFCGCKSKILTMRHDPFADNNPTLSSSSPDSDSPVPLSQINIPHPVHNIPMDLVRAINRYVTPPASPTNHEPWRSESNLDLPSESTSSDTLIEGVAFSSVTTTSISDSGEPFASYHSTLCVMYSLCFCRLLRYTIGVDGHGYPLYPGLGVSRKYRYVQ